MFAAVGGVIGLVKIGAMIAIAVVIFNVGKTSMENELRPVIVDLENRYNKVHTDLSILNAEAVGLEAIIKADLTMIGKDSEVKDAKIQAEITLRVERYLDSLANTSMSGTQGPDNLHPGRGSIGTLSSLAKTLGDGCDGKLRLYRTLLDVDQRIGREILLPFERTKAKLKKCTQYGDAQEAKMKPLREQLEAAKRKIKDSQIKQTD